ncbi:hypothetical protein [Nonomuraea helvata]|uniref:Uncharacterized protein n=1 Tax=Nonomuraea helvata TaxID=37484 RepID=A0ABV5SCX4_9ACTN
MSKARKLTDQELDDVLNSLSRHRIHNALAFLAGYDAEAFAEVAKRMGGGAR